MITVETLAVCDPAPVAMEGLRSLMMAMGGPRVVAMDTNLEDAVETVHELRPAILVIDKSYGNHTLTDWLRILRTSGADTAAIVWGTPLSEPEALRYFQAGAAGIIRKSAPLHDLWSCIQTVASGGAWMEHEILRDPGRPV